MSQSQQIPLLYATGHIDYAKNGYVYGWAIDSQNPTQNVSIEIICDDRVVAYGVADEYRADLRNANIGDGYHGFRLKLSYEVLDNQQHKFIGIDCSSGYYLRGGPIDFGPESRVFVFDIIARNTGLEILDKILRSSKNSKVLKKRDEIRQAYILGALAQETQRYEDASFAWKALIRVIGANSLCYCKLAEIALHNGEIVAAKELYLEATYADISLYWGHLGIYNCNVITKDFAGALKSLAVVQALRPEDSELIRRAENLKAIELKKYILSLETSGNGAEALRFLKQLLRENPKSQVAATLLGESLTQGNRYDLELSGSSRIRQYEQNLAVFEFFVQEFENKGI